jgi:hypothetical protein
MHARRGRGPGEHRRTSRRIGGRQRRARVLIVVGGEVTENEYFNHLRQEAEQRQIALTVTVVPHGAPRRIVKKAQELVRKDRDAARLDEGNRWDKVYAVTDVDAYGDQISGLLSESLGPVELVISNPCFEVWLVCHSAETPELTCSGLQHQAARLGLVGGKRNKHPVLSRLTTAAFMDAEMRAKRLRQRHERAGHVFPEDVPSTQVDRIVRHLLG